MNISRVELNSQKISNNANMPVEFPNLDGVKNIDGLNFSPIDLELLNKKLEKFTDGHYATQNRPHDLDGADLDGMPLIALAHTALFNLAKFLERSSNLTVKDIEEMSEKLEEIQEENKKKALKDINSAKGPEIFETFWGIFKSPLVALAGLKVIKKRSDIKKYTVAFLSTVLAITYAPALIVAAAGTTAAVWALGSAMMAAGSYAFAKSVHDAVQLLRSSVGEETKESFIEKFGQLLTVQILELVEKVSDMSTAAFYGLNSAYSNVPNAAAAVPLNQLVPNLLKFREVLQATGLYGYVDSTVKRFDKKLTDRNVAEKKAESVEQKKIEGLLKSAIDLKVNSMKQQFSNIKEILENAKKVTEKQKEVHRSLWN